MNGRADVPYETLDLPEPARSLFRKTRVALETHVSAYAADGEGYKLGGGTILAARWKHRRSNDIDILFHPDTKTSHFEAELGKALTEAGGAPLGWGESSRIEFGESHLDLLKGEPTPAVGHQPASVDGSPVTVLTNVQILYGKLGYRALDPPTRDVTAAQASGRARTHPSVECPPRGKGVLAMTGFLGTRADVFMDLAITFFVAAPFLMTYALRLAARGRYRAHRNLQAGLVVGGTVAVLLLEGSIQYGEAMAAYAQSAYYGTPLIRGLFSVHLWVAIPWFIGWCVLTVVSWRRYSRVLPGPFSSTHRLCGVVTYAGFWFTCITGVAMYVLCYAL